MPKTTPTPAEKPKAKKTDEAEISANILGDLSKPIDRVVEKPKSETPSKPVSNVDRNVLDGLLGNDQNAGGGKSP